MAKCLETVKGDSKNLSAETEASECLETDLRTLMENIESGDLMHCQAIVSKMDSKFLNKRVKIPHPQYKDVRVSPLLAAVIFQRHDALEMLLSRSVKVDKIGYYEDQNILYTVTPLLKAIMNADTRSVKMLLDRGARVQIGIPGPKIAEEEGYYYQYTKMSFPLNHAMQAGLSMFKLVFQNADALMEYGEYRHTCLCYAIGHYLSDPEIVDPRFIHFIAQSGGMICGGRRYNKDRDRLCFYLCDLFFKSFGGPKMSTLSPGLPVHVTYMFSENHIEIVKLLCLLEYNHAGSIVQKFMKTYGNLLCKSFKPLHWEHIKLNYPDVVSFVSWVTNYNKTPSSLKEICRCAIRQSIHRISVEKCHSLPLPSDLKRFLCLETQLAIQVPDSVCLHCYGSYILK